MSHFYIARYVGSATEADPYRPDLDDVADWSAVDLRPNPSIPAGRAICATSELLPAAPVGQRAYLGDTPDVPSQTLQALVAGQLGVTVGANTVRGVLRELLTVHGGGPRWKPLQAERDGHFRVHLGDLADDFLPVNGPDRPSRSAPS